jgi:hypothetical protein
MRRSKQHLLNQLERPRRYGMPYLIVATVKTLLTTDLLF